MVPGILLTQSNTFLIGPIAKALGWIFDKIFIFMDSFFNVQNIAVCIVIFTFVIYLFMLPLTIKQQKFSKLSAKMNPELQAIQKKYKNKKDQNSMMAMNEETKMIYEKYGVSPTGGCLQLIIQMPILFALYRVIMNVPAYVGSVKNIFTGLVDQIFALPDYQNLVSELAKAAKTPVDFSTVEAGKNTIVDVLYKLQTADWASLPDKISEFAGHVQSGMEQLITTTANELAHINNFFGINIADSPLAIIKDNFANGVGIGIVIAILIPVLAAVTQILNVKLMPQPQANGNDQNVMGSTMKSMNLMMPLMSAVFCFSFPIGLGLYWVAGAVVRSIQQVAINKYMDRVDMDQLIAKNAEKAAKKRAKKGLPPQKVNSVARQNLRNIDEPSKKSSMSAEERQAAIEKSTEYYKTHEAKPGSIASKARMVQQYNDKNEKSKKK